MKKYQEIWELALPYSKQGSMKDFVTHTEGVVKAMKILLETEGGDENLLIPAAILHDVGFAKIAKELQTSRKEEDKRKALELHLKYAKPIIEEILGQLNYPKGQISQIVDIVQAHKFQDPKELNKRLLIDADSLSDVFKEQFLMDMQVYHRSAQELLEFRKENSYYTKTAQRVADKELAARTQEQNL